MANPLEKLNRMLPGKKGDPPGEGNPYYLEKAGKWRSFRWKFLIFVLVFLVLFFALNAHSLKLENFHYFFSDLRASVAVRSYEQSPMEYVSDSKQSFTTFRGGLCIAGTHNVSVFTQTSRQLLSDTVNLSSPVVTASDKYVMVYDQGGRNFLVYNTFSRILSETLDEPILYGAVSNRGDLAVVTLGAENVSNVYLYNAAMDRVAKIKKNVYVTAVAFDRDTKFLTLCGMDGVNGAYELSVESYAMGKRVSAEPVSRATVSGCFPLYLSYTGSGKLFLVCDTRLICFGPDLGMQLNYHLSQRLVAADAGPEGCALALDSNLVRGEVRVMCWDAEGRERTDRILTADAEQILMQDGRVYLKGETLTRITLSDGKTETAGTNVAGMKLLAGKNGKLYLCSASQATETQFEKL